jgi:hypothetical protein
MIQGVGRWCNHQETVLEILCLHGWSLPDQTGSLFVLSRVCRQVALLATSVDHQLGGRPDAFKPVSCTMQTHASTIHITVGVITIQFTSQSVNMLSVHSVASSSVTTSHNGTYKLVSCNGQAHANAVLHLHRAVKLYQCFATFNVVYKVHNSVTSV